MQHSSLLSADDNASIDHAPSGSSTPPNQSREFPGPVPGPHRNFWILSTREVNGFIAASVNRWLLCLEALVSRSVKGPETLQMASEEEQYLNGVLISALVHILCLTFGGQEPTDCRALWLPSWRRKQKQAQNTNLSTSDDDSESDPEDRDDPKTIEVLGLGLREMVRNLGVAWLPADMFLWESLPMFKRSTLRSLALAQDDNGFQQIFHATKGIQEKLSRQSIKIGLFRDKVSAAIEEDPASLSPRRIINSGHSVFALGSELVIQQYIQRIFAILATRKNEDSALDSPSDTKDHPSAQKVFRLRLSNDELAGFRGLSFAIIRRLLSHPPHTILAREPTKGKGVNAKQPYFESSSTGLWIDRVRELFLWGDHQDRKVRGWNNEPFRQLTRQIYRIFEQECNQAAADRFLEQLAWHAHLRLLIILQYDYDKLSVLKKASKHNGEETRVAIKTSSSLARTQWFMPQFPPHLHRSFQAAEQHVDRCEPPTAQILGSAFLNKEMLVHKQSSTQWSGVPRDPHVFRLKTKLDKAEYFSHELDGLFQTLELEGTSDDDSD